MKRTKREYGILIEEIDGVWAWTRYYRYTGSPFGKIHMERFWIELGAQL